jgi:hypothetical protein
MRCNHPRNRLFLWRPNQKVRQRRTPLESMWFNLRMARTGLERENRKWRTILKTTPIDNFNWRCNHNRVKRTTACEHLFFKSLKFCTRFKGSNRKWRTIPKTTPTDDSCYYKLQLLCAVGSIEPICPSEGRKPLSKLSQGWGSYQELEWERLMHRLSWSTGRRHDKLGDLSNNLITLYSFLSDWWNR